VNVVQNLNMVQLTVATSDSAGPPGRRARNRLVRHRAFLDAALRIATVDGLDALTMQRLADEVDTAIGTVYTYFPSKGALVAEVQRGAVDRLTASYLLLRPLLEEQAEQLPAPEATLVHVVGFARFCIASMDTLPQEQRLLQDLMHDADHIVPTEEGARVLPSVWRLLDMARRCIEDAAAAGALRSGEPLERTVVLAAALNGVLQLSKLARWEADLLDGARLARALVDDLVVGWGADPRHVATAHHTIDTIERRQALARPAPQGADA
jgi:AcrR family transcriptional regulator